MPTGKRSILLFLRHGYARLERSISPLSLIGGFVFDAVVGGRDGGYLTFSQLSAIKAGLWRVGVDTPGGQAIDRSKFRVIVQDKKPPLRTESIH
jgi:hypothetical protein